MVNWRTHLRSCVMYPPNTRRPTLFLLLLVIMQETGIALTIAEQRRLFLGLSITILVSPPSFLSPRRIKGRRG
jgi:hypothetical protein